MRRRLRTRRWYVKIWDRSVWMAARLGATMFEVLVLAVLLVVAVLFLAGVALFILVRTLLSIMDDGRTEIE